MKRKLALCLMLALVLIAVMIPATALAAPEKTETEPAAGVYDGGHFGNDLVWEFYDDATLRIRGNGAMPDFSFSNIPWAAYTSYIEKVVIESGITNISQYALQDCTEMETLEIADTVTTIGREAVLGCTSLPKVTIPASVKEIDVRGFADCTNLAFITFMGGAPSAGISSDAFRDVDAYVYYPPVYTWTDSKRQNYGGTLEWICDKYCGSNLTWSVTSDGVLNITGTGAMKNYEDDYPGWYYVQDKWHSANIENGVTTISPYAFYKCHNITDILFPDTITDIGEFAFCYCESLDRVYIPDTVTKIANHTFYDCESLTDFGIQGKITSIGNYAFWGCSSLPRMVIPESVTEIGTAAFEQCSSLKNIYFRGDAPTIGDYAFYDDILTAYYPPVPSWTADVRRSYDGDVTWVCDNSCGTGLTWSVSSAGILTISGTGAMYDYPIEYPDWIEVPGWYYLRDTWNSVKINSGATRIGDYAFYCCDNLKSVTIPSTVTTIGLSAFDNCTELTGIAIPDSVTDIGEYAFYYCEKLAAVTMGTGLKTIGKGAFEDCGALTAVTIGPAVTDISGIAFYDCSALKTVTIPVSVKNIGLEAFGCCNSLELIIYGGTEVDWGKVNISNGNNCLTSAAIQYTYKPLTAPTNVKAVADTATTMKVSWSAVPGATKYVVYRKEGSADWKAFTNTTGTSITLKTNLKHGYNYRFRIYAKNAQYTSAGSEIVLLKFIPPTPTGLTISSTGVGQATIKWDAIPNIKGYCVYYKRADDSGYTYAGATTATSKTITGLTTGARYAFKIRAYVPATAGVYQGQNIFSEYCKYVSGEIVPAAPTGLKIASTDTGKATISWNKVSGAYAYCIYYKRADDAGYTYFGATTATSKTITGLTTGARYAFKIRAYAKPTDGPKAGQNVFGPYCKYVSGAITPK